MRKPHHQSLLIIDFGSQVTQLIARRLRELNVYCEVHPFQIINKKFLTCFAPKAIILSGGPASVLERNAPRPPRETFELNVPILGICYGQQVMMDMLGGKVKRSQHTAEFGRAYVTKEGSDISLLKGWFNNDQSSNNTKNDCRNSSHSYFFTKKKSG